MDPVAHIKGNTRSTEATTKGKHPASRRLTRRQFLVASAGIGAGLFALGLNTLVQGARKEVTPLRDSSLEIFREGYPRAFFFRQPEVDARKGRLSYEEWEKRYLPLNGILGKVLDERTELVGENNLSFFLKYKENNPTKIVLLHYLGAGRRATDTTNGFFAGHWLHYAGTNSTEELDASPSATVLYVTDTSVFSIDRVEGVPDDVVIAPVDEHGKPDWESAEQLKLEEIDPENNSITVKRAAYGTEARSFPRGSYLAAHVLTPPYPSGDTSTEDDRLWSYNFSTVGPRDARGRNGADALVDYLVQKLGPGGPLATFDGIEFDVLSFGVRNGNPIADVDVDADGVADSGIIDSVDVMGLGTLEFTKALRARLPGKIIMADGQKPNKLQRSFGDLNGIETEGFSDMFDVALDHLSTGMNILRFWQENSASPSINYINFKYVDAPGQSDQSRNTFKEPNLTQDQSYKKLRLALACAQFTDALFAYPADWSPPETLWRQQNNMVRVFDELCQGVDQNPNWLGMPLGPAVHLAGEAEDLLSGQGKSWPQDFIERMSGEGVEFARDAAVSMIVGSSDSEDDTPVLEKTVEFTLPEIEVPAEDLFVSVRLKADPLKGYPASIGRRVYVTATPEGGSDGAAREFAWVNEKPLTATFYFTNVGMGSVDLSFEVEGDRPVYFEKLSAHSATDAMYREFENGVVFANPSKRSYTFDLTHLFPGASFRRLLGFKNQDQKTNDGQPLGEKLTLGARDGLFVVRSGRAVQPPPTGGA